MKEKQQKNLFKYYLYIFSSAFVIGTIMWAFLYIVNTLLHFLWIGPNEGDGLLFTINPFLTIVFIFSGALLAALIANKYQVLPPTPKYAAQNLDKSVKATHWQLALVFFGSMIPLIIGASVGPEATLIVLGFILIDRLNANSANYANKLNLKISHQRGTKIIDSLKMDYRYVIGLVFLALGVAIPLVAFSYLDHFPPFFTRLPQVKWSLLSLKDFIFILPLLLCGYLLGHYFMFIEHFIKSLFAKIKSNLFKVLIGASFITFCVFYFPLIILSGEATLPVLLEIYTNYSPFILIIVSLTNVILTTICLSSNLRGGHIFPILFTAFSFGLAASLLFSIDATLSIAAVTATMTLKLYKNTTAVFLLLALFFPLPVLIGIFFLVFLLRNAKKINKKEVGIEDLEDSYEIK